MAEAGGFSRAAEVVHVSQPAISMQVAALEESLGTPLLDRLPRGVRLTDAGKILLGHAQRIGTLEGGAERAMRELRVRRHGLGSFHEDPFHRWLPAARPRQERTGDQQAEEWEQ